MKHETGPAFPTTSPSRDAPHVEQHMMSIDSSREVPRPTISAASILKGLTPSLMLPGGWPLCSALECLGFFLLCFFVGPLPDQTQETICNWLGFLWQRHRDETGGRSRRGVVAMGLLNGVQGSMKCCQVASLHAVSVQSGTRSGSGYGDRVSKQGVKGLM